MSGRAKTVVEVMFEQLTVRVAELTQERKALESAIKEIQSQVFIAEKEAEASVALVQSDTDKTLAILKESVKPLQELQTSCNGLRSEIVRLKQDKIDAATDVKEARSNAIKTADEREAKSALRLGKLEKAIDACKAAVASL